MRKEDVKTVLQVLYAAIGPEETLKALDDAIYDYKDKLKL